MFIRSLFGEKKTEAINYLRTITTKKMFSNLHNSYFNTSKTLILIGNNLQFLSRKSGKLFFYTFYHKLASKNS